jgi:2-polyprenyl-6-methoxyphenol hydroxylase-like FAD-dependent oxidoreductase
MYDVIVVGARVAGASTALLLARRGLKVLAVDRAEFPSDTLSTHQVQVPGVARLRRWGILDGVLAAGTPAAAKVRFDPGPVVLRGRFPEFEGASAVYSPRRTLLDKLLVDAARAAGAEVRERFAFDQLVWDGDRVSGIRGRSAGGGVVTETAQLVVGADGRHSAVAKAVRAPAYHVKPALTTAYYTYWSGVELGGGEIYGRQRCVQRLVGAWPTNDGLVMTYVAAPASEFHAFRADPEGSILAALDRCGDLGERVRAGARAERVFGTADTQNRFHEPGGPGWALVGDAGLVLDPVTGAGIADALRDAELLSHAVAAGLDGGPPLDQALAGYQAARDAAALPMYEMTIDLASFAPPRPEQEMLLRALEGNQPEIDRFLSVLTGSLPGPEYFTARNMLRLIGVRGLWQATRSQRKMRS